MALGGTSFAIEGDPIYQFDVEKYTTMPQNLMKVDLWNDLVNETSHTQYFIKNLLVDLVYFAEDKTDGVRSTFDIFEALVCAYSYASEPPKPVYLAHKGSVNLRLIRI